MEQKFIVGITVVVAALALLISSISMITVDVEVFVLLLLTEIVGATGAANTYPIPSITRRRVIIIIFHLLFISNTLALTIHYT